MQIIPMKKIVLTAAGLLALTTTTLVSADLAVIANASLKIPALNQEQAQQLFLNKSTDYSQQKIVVLSNESGTNALFYKQVVKMSASKFRSYWSTQVFTGKGSAPIYLNSDSEVLDFVAKNKGAIGFVDADTVGKEVSTLLIIPSG
ncbi:MAG: hypothetical protein U5M23_10175 [Marinagarivorans sp.]|nr:hypothetical protein [Marinagarivorans sp.]